MRKFFGSKVVQASKADTPGATSSSRRQPTALRSHLTRPQPAWAQARTREGLSIRPLTDIELRHQGAGSVPGEKWWTVEYSKKYKSMTKVFIQTVQAGGTSEYPCDEKLSSFSPQTLRAYSTCAGVCLGMLIRYCRWPKYSGIARNIPRLSTLLIGLCSPMSGPSSGPSRSQVV